MPAGASQSSATVAASVPTTKPGSSRAIRENHHRVVARAGSASELATRFAESTSSRLAPIWWANTTCRARNCGYAWGPMNVLW